MARKKITIDGNDAANNETKIMKNFDANVWYQIQLQVSDSAIVAWVDNQKLVDFNYLGRELNRAEICLFLGKPYIQDE